MIRNQGLEVLSKGIVNKNGATKWVFRVTGHTPLTVLINITSDDH